MKAEIGRRLQVWRTAGGAGANRKTGDAARDRKEWPTAEREYAAHLATVPGDQAIWVQYGHCLKEQGKRDEAEAAYRRAIELQPDDPDAHLQLGHVLKLLGRREEAHEAYLESATLKPSKAALDEAHSVGGAGTGPDLGTVPAAQDRPDTIYLEVDDILDYLRGYRTVSGIQRVQVGIIQHALAQPDAEAGQFAFIRTGRHGTGFWRLDPGDLLGIVNYVKQAAVSQPRLLSMIEAAEQRATRVEPVQSQLYFVLGAFWGFGSNAARYARLKRAGVRLGVYIYDLIPITHPEYCSSGLVTEFTLALGDGLHVFDFILTISEYVAKDVRRYLASNGLRAIPVEAVPLAHRIHDDPVQVPAHLQSAAWTGDLAPLQGRPFVLMVSTIEPRKNHVYLYNVWKALIEEGLDPPDLVFVGRFGWRVNDLRDMLEGTDYLGGRIHVLHDLSDVALEVLYKACLFTAFPSIIEGWGLPVGESLTHGRPSVASSTSSIPEVGGDFVDYVDPWNLRDGIRVFRKMITDGAYRAARTRRIQEGFVPRTWSDVGRDLLGRLSKFRKLPAGSYAPPLLAPGEVIVPSVLTISGRAPAGYASRPLRTLLAESWFVPEAFGAWMRGNDGSIQFSTGLAPGTRVTAYLRLRGAPWASDHAVGVSVGRTGLASGPAPFPALARTDAGPHPVQADEEFLVRASGKVDADGTVTVLLHVRGNAVMVHAARHAADDRDFNVGLVALSYAKSSDAELRVDLFERFSVPAGAGWAPGPAGPRPRRSAEVQAGEAKAGQVQAQAPHVAGPQLVIGDPDLAVEAAPHGVAAPG